MLLQNRSEKVSGGGEEERRYHQIRLSMKKYLRRDSSQVHRIEWREQRWGRRWIYYLQNLQDPLDRTDGEMWRLGSMPYIQWIYLPKVLWQERYSRRWWFFFVAFALDHKHKGQISIQLSTAVLNPSRPLRFWKLYWNENLTSFFLFVRDRGTQKYIRNLPNI